MADRREHLDGRADRFLPLLALVALLAFVIREQFVLTAIVDAPIRGDIREYVNYAWNLVHHGVFSLEAPAMHTPPPDAYRSPGYPFLLAVGMAWFPHDLDWISFVLQVQVLLGTATVVLAGLLAREWLSSTWSVAAAALIALWPHHIAATEAMLSEVVFGFALLAGLFCIARAWRKRGSKAWFAGAGAAMGYAWLINPILLPFPLALAVLAWRHGEGRGATLLLGIFLLPVAAMLIRDARIDAPERGSMQRARMNFVQGSWPGYHKAANRFRAGDPIAVWIMGQIRLETNALRDDPLLGAEVIGSRIATEPGFYARWYVSKGWLLWGWKIQIGADDIDYHEVKRSPLSRAPLRWIVATYRAINPLLTTLLLVGCLALPALGWRERRWMPAAATGGLALYLTLAHLVLQAEPRYAIAYRGLEAVIVASVCALGVRCLRRNPS